MTSMPAVSVIIPTFNRAALLPQAIDSVLQQTFSDFEIIVVDDGSVDDTETVARAYGDRVQYVKTPNGGTAHARNVGMQRARGRYLTFLDSDDLLYPYALELEVALLDRFPGVSMVCAEVTGFDDDGFVERYHLKNYHRSSFRDPAVTYDAIFPANVPLGETGALPAAVLEEEPDVARRRAYYGNIFDSYILRIVLFQNNAMLRREVVAEIGPRRQHIFNFEEYDYLLRLSRHHDVLFADVPTYKLRYHPGQMSGQSGRDGVVVWMRKQRALLKVVTHHVLADQAYYLRHKERLDRHLADVHRAAAVPLLLLDRGNRHRHAKYARLCLDRCRTYGHPVRLLYAASFLPGAIRHPAVAVMEGVRKDGVKALASRAVAALLPGSRRRTARASTT